MTRFDPARGRAEGVGTPGHDTRDTPRTSRAWTRHTDPTTAREAAGTVPVRGQRAAILAALHRDGQVTADQMQVLHPMVHRSSWSSRLAAMRRDGLVVVVDQVRTPCPTTGRMRPVLVFGGAEETSR